MCGVHHTDAVACSTCLTVPAMDLALRGHCTDTAFDDREASLGQLMQDAENYKVHVRGTTVRVDHGAGGALGAGTGKGKKRRGKLLTPEEILRRARASRHVCHSELEDTADVVPCRQCTIEAAQGRAHFVLPSAFVCPHADAGCGTSLCTRHARHVVGPAPSCSAHQTRLEPIPRVRWVGTDMVLKMRAPHCEVCGVRSNFSVAATEWICSTTCAARVPRERCSVPSCCVSGGSTPCRVCRWLQPITDLEAGTGAGGETSGQLALDVARYILDREHFRLSVHVALSAQIEEGHGCASPEERAVLLLRCIWRTCGRNFAKGSRLPESVRLARAFGVVNAFMAQRRAGAAPAPPPLRELDALLCCGEAALCIQLQLAEH